MPGTRLCLAILRPCHLCLDDLSTVGTLPSSKLGGLCYSRMLVFCRSGPLGQFFKVGPNLFCWHGSSCYSVQVCRRCGVSDDNPKTQASLAHILKRPWSTSSSVPGPYPQASLVHFTKRPWPTSQPENSRRARPSGVARACARRRAARRTAQGTVEPEA